MYILIKNHHSYQLMMIVNDILDSSLLQMILFLDTIQIIFLLAVFFFFNNTIISIIEYYNTQ